MFIGTQRKWLTSFPREKMGPAKCLSVWIYKDSSCSPHKKTNNILLFAVKWPNVNLFVFFGRSIDSSKNLHCGLQNLIYFSYPSYFILCKRLQLYAARCHEVIATWSQWTQWSPTSSSCSTSIASEGETSRFSFSHLTCCNGCCHWLWLWLGSGLVVGSGLLVLKFGFLLLLLLLLPTIAVLCWYLLLLLSKPSSIDKTNQNLNPSITVHHHHNHNFKIYL